MTHEKKNKHMTLDDRIEIQECLNKGMTFKAIGQRVGKDQTTISKEVVEVLLVIVIIAFPPLTPVTKPELETVAIE